mgnify:CR=1 FL=1
MPKEKTILVNGSPYGLALYAGGAKTAEELKKAYKKYVSIKSESYQTQKEITQTKKRSSKWLKQIRD